LRKQTSGARDLLELNDFLHEFKLSCSRGLRGLFCELRRRSGSLLASARLHRAANGLAVLAVAAVWAWAPG
jgi:hypothetical protein